MAIKIGILGGTGPLGQGLALRWGLAKQSIIIGSRDQKKADQVSQLINTKLNEDLVIPVINKECIIESELILLTIPFEHLVSTITPFLNLLSSEQILVDVTVPLKPFVKGRIVDVLSEIEIGAKSATELLRKVVPSEIPIIGAFKTLSSNILIDVKRLPILSQDVYVYGKDKSAKMIVKNKVKLIKSLRPVDAGGTLSARHIENMVAFLIGLNRRYKTHDCGFSVTGLPFNDW